MSKAGKDSEQRLAKVTGESFRYLYYRSESEMERSHNWDGITMSQKKEQVSDKDESWFKNRKRSK